MAAPSQHMLGIDPKMYRHFTALTLVISFSIALFANGEQQRTKVPVPTSKIAKPEKKAKGPRSEADVLNGVSGDPSPVQMGSAPPPPPPSSGDGPLDPVPVEDGQAAPKGNRFAYRRPPTVVDPALLARMTPQQRAAYLQARALDDQQPGRSSGGPGGASSGASGNRASAPSQQQIDHLVAASRARSGASD